MNYEYSQEKLGIFLIRVDEKKEDGITTVMLMSTSPSMGVKTSNFTVRAASTDSPTATAHREKAITTSAAATVSHSAQGTERTQNLTMIIEQVLSRTDPACV